MKNIMIFAAVLAIAMVVALNFGLGWLFAGIIFALLCEYCYFSAYESALKKDQYLKNLKLSRKMIFAHAAWCVATILLAYAFGCLNGFDVVVEEAKGNTFEYVTVHQNGYWWFLLVILTARVVAQPFIESAIKQNIEQVENLKA